MSKSSDIQSALEPLRLNDYLSLTLVMVIVYDYFLTFSREIAYVWCRPWTRVSTMFILVRYAGLCWAIFNGLAGTTFVPGPSRADSCIAVNLVIQWAFPIFYNAADLVMILRVYAMWNQSKKILYFLLSIYVLQVIFIITYAIIDTTPTPSQYYSIMVVQIGDVAFCKYVFGNISANLQVYGDILPIFLGTLLLVLAVVQIMKEALEMYKMTKQWQPNRYIKQFVRDGILYFLANVLYNILPLAESGATYIPPSVSLFIMAFTYTCLPLLMPRFIISVRELYDREARGGWEGDTGFGVSSQPRPNEHMSVIAFADGVLQQDEAGVGTGADESEGIQLEPRGDNTHQV